MAQRKVLVKIRLEPSVARKLKKVASDEDRSISAQGERFIERALARSRSW